MLNAPCPAEQQVSLQIPDLYCFGCVHGGISPQIPILSKDPFASCRTYNEEGIGAWELGYVSGSDMHTVRG